MSKIIHEWALMELHNRLEKINEFLEGKKADFTLSQDQLASVSFGFEKTKQFFTHFYVKDETQPDEYRLGRLIGRVYHRMHNPLIFTAQYDERQVKLEHAVEHMFGMILLMSNDFSARIDAELLDDYSSARDKHMTYNLLDEKTFQIKQARKHAEEERTRKAQLKLQEEEAKKDKNLEERIWPKTPHKLPKKKPNLPPVEKLQKSHYIKPEAQKTPKQYPTKAQVPEATEPKKNIPKPKPSPYTPSPGPQAPKQYEATKPPKTKPEKKNPPLTKGYEAPNLDELTEGHYPDSNYLPKPDPTYMKSDFKAENTAPESFEIDGLSDYKKIETGFTDDPFLTQLQKRKHDAFYASLAIIQGRGDGTNNYLRVLSELLRSDKDGALYALYSVLEF